MAHNFCSFCSWSCCTTPSPSPPHSSQQQPISSPPPPQTITPHSSSPEPSVTMTEFRNFLQKFNDISQIHTLIPLLEDLLKIASGKKSDDGGSAAGSYIQDGQIMLEMLNRRIRRRAVKKNSGEDTVEEIEKVCIEVLKGSEKIPKVGIAFCMLGSVVEKFNVMSENRKECLDVLERMVYLGKLILKLNEQIPGQKEKLDEGVQCIIVGTIMCFSQLARSTILSFLTATVNKESLNAFQLKVDRLCMDILLSTGISIGERVIDMGKTVIDIGDRVPQIASESQKFYAYQQTVGIEGSQERVIQLLDLNAQDTIPVVVVVHGFGGIGKTTLADAVYAELNLQSYKHFRIHMDQDCTKNDLKGLQEQILNGLFTENIKLKNCDEGQGRLWSFFKNNPDQPLFLYIDNSLKSTDLEQLLPKGLDNCLPPKSRILITTRNLDETNIFVAKNIVRRQYDVNPLPEREGRKLLLQKVSEYNDEDNIAKLLKMCGGVPLLLELAGSQLAINKGNRKNIVLEMVNEGEQVKERDISDRMVGFVYDRLLPPVQDAFLDITSFFYKKNIHKRYVASIVGEEEFRALEAASFIKTSEKGGLIVHDIVQARGKKLSKGNRIIDVNTLSECLKDDEKVEKLRGISFDLYEGYDQPAIEINCHHLNCMSDSLRVLRYKGSQMTFTDKCQKPFEQLRCLIIHGHVSDIPMEFEKLEHLVLYEGPFTQDMNLYEFPASLRFMSITNHSENRVAYSRVPPKVPPASSLVKLGLCDFRNMQRLPDGVEKLTKLESLSLWDCHQLRELPSKLTDLSSLRELTLYQCNELKDLPSNFGQLKNLEELNLSYCSGLVELSSDFGQLQNLKKLDLTNCFKLEEWPLSFGDLTEMREIDLSNCLSKLKDSLPENIKRNNCRIEG